MQEEEQGQTLLCHLTKGWPHRGDSVGTEGMTWDESPSVVRKESYPRSPVHCVTQHHCQGETARRVEKQEDVICNKEGKPTKTHSDPSSMLELANEDMETVARNLHVKSSSEGSLGGAAV